MNSCVSALRRGPSRFEIDPQAFLENYLDSRRRSRAKGPALNRPLAFAGVGLLVALVASIAVLSTRFFLLDRNEALLEPPEGAPEVV
jgi:hypothetical protein